MRLILLVVSAALTACAVQPAVDPKTAEVKPVQAAATRAPYSSTYQPLPGVPTLIRNATILTGAGERIDGGDVLFQNGRIESVGRALTAPQGARVIDAQGRWVTPGLIDVHSHLGVYASPGTFASNDGNESTDPVTANVWAEHSVWPQDPGFQTALEGGVTTLQLLPGSANLIGGRWRHRQERPGHHLPGDEISRRAAGPQDGLRRESEAGVRQPGSLSVDAHGQRRRLSPGIRRRAGLPAPVGEVRPRARGVTDDKGKKEKKDPIAPCRRSAI